MTRSKTIFSALLCSVSFISLTAQAAPSAVTDWHVAPVLSPGSNSMPYCALATNYPEAGVIVTHARNKHGTGTIAFDFQDGEFEADQYYGIEVSFDNMTRTFAAQARNNHLLVVEMAEDHPLYAALNAGQDLTVAVQNGGPSVTLAGNSRPFFQLNYCVQALNDDAAAEVIVQRPNSMPSFGLQQLSTAPILTPPAVRPKPLPVAQPQPQIAQAAAQDGDASRAELENMLDKARSTETKPVRQKLSSISSNDDIDPSTIAPVNRNARQSLLFDDPTAANAYVPPKLSGVEQSADTTTSVKAKKPAPVAAPKAIVTSKPVAQEIAKPVIPAPVVAPVKKEIAETIAAPVAVKTPSTLPEPMPLPQDDAPIAAPKTQKMDALSHVLTKGPVAPPVPPLKPAMVTAKPVVAAAVKPAAEKVEIKSATSRTVLASDYAKEQETGITAKAYSPETAAKKVEKVKAPVAAAPAPAVPDVKHTDITWDAPVVAATKTVAPESMTTPAAAKETVKTAEKAAEPKTVKAAVTEKTETAKAEPKVDAAPVTENSALAAPAPVIKKPVVAKAVVPEKKIAPEATIARAEGSVMPAAPVMPAPALPPAYVADEPINNSVRGPMKRADEVVAVSFPEDETNDGEILNAPLPQATMVVAQNNTTPSVPAALLQSPAPGGSINFNPPPSKTSLPWDVSATGNPGEGGFCVMKNRFQNQQNLFLSRGTDGSATLGIDYGMDLLQVNRDYKTTIQLDHLFTEDFTGEARQANLLVVQMGRKDSFFDALRQAKALHIALDGSASTFDVKGIAEKIPAFNSCMVSQGGVKLPEATPVAVAAPTPVAAIAPAPVAKAVTNNSLPAPKTTAEIKAATTGVNTMVTPQAAPVLAASPSAATPAPAAPVAMSLTTAQVNALLAQSHITGTVRAEGANYKWGGVSDAVQGTLSEQRFAAGKEDLLEGVMRDIDASEKMCGGEFASEIGIPEQHGNMEALPTESSCTTNGDKIVSASLYQRVGQIFRVWTQKSSQSNRDLLVSQRDRLANIVLKD